MLKFAKYRQTWFRGDARSELSVSLSPVWPCVRAHYGRASPLERPPPSTPGTFCHWPGSRSSKFSLFHCPPPSVSLSTPPPPPPGQSLPAPFPPSLLSFLPSIHVFASMCGQPAPSLDSTWLSGCQAQPGMDHCCPHGVGSPSRGTTNKVTELHFHEPGVALSSMSYFICPSPVTQVR